MTKSPFLVQQEFLSPMLCEQIADDLNFAYPDKDKDGKPVLTRKSHDRSEEVIFQHLQRFIPTIESHYGIEYRGTTQMSFEWQPEDSDGVAAHCENSEYIKKKWCRVRDRDISGVIFLCDYQDKLPFDGEFEVYGGKLEFPQHQFGFNPQRGTLILFPSEAHFLNGCATILAGDSYLVRFHIAAMKPYLYDPTEFPGDFTVWFEEFA